MFRHPVQSYDERVIEQELIEGILEGLTAEIEALIDKARRAGAKAATEHLVEDWAKWNGVPKALSKSPLYRMALRHNLDIVPRPAPPPPPPAKLPVSERNRIILALHERGVGQKEIGEVMGLSRSQAGKIINGKTR